jgi:hypothetical protein
MPSLEALRARSADLFTNLPRRRAGSEPAAAARERPFSWFNPDDAVEAVGLAAQLAIVSGAAPTVDQGLQRALDLVEARAEELPPDLVNEAMALFVTHHTPARQLVKPRIVRIRPELFSSSRPADAVGPAGAPGPEGALDYWREDPFANEHHAHWHQVYPYPGLPLSGDWLLWAEVSDRAGLAALLGVLDQTRDWPAFLAAATSQEIRDEFLRLAEAVLASAQTWRDFVRQLSAPAYRVLFRLNDRQGELFFYMHGQMLARYDAERLSHGLEPVKPFSPELFGEAIPEGTARTCRASPAVRRAGSSRRTAWTCSSPGRARSMPRSPTASCSGRSDHREHSTATRSGRPPRLHRHS